MQVFLQFIILLFIVNILAYAIIAGVLASMTTNIEDYQQLQSPIMIIMMMGYFIAIMASTFDGSIFIEDNSAIQYSFGWLKYIEDHLFR